VSDRGQGGPKTPEVLFKAVVQPLQDFFRLEAASGILLLCSAAIALVWANSPVRDSYTAIFDAPLTIGVRESQVHFTFHHLINDGLMAIFFFVVGMEIKRELVVGELRTPSRALLPLVAALGGMVIPAAIYVVLNRGTPGLVGWAIPMATDIAFCIGCLSLLKSRVPHALVVFLTALAIFDDMGGILVIALFYGSGLHVSWLLGALAITGGLFVLNRLRVSNGLAYAVGGGALWYTLHHGGIHATIAGVILGMMIPARASRPSQQVLAELHAHTTHLVREPREEELGDAELLAIEERLEELESPLNRFVHLLHPYVAFLIMPLFALANSGVSLAGIGLEALMNRISLGAALGLFLGKQLGIFLFTLVAVRLGLAPMPGGASRGKLYGVAVIAGIGFTVALFIAGLAFPEPRLLDYAKIGILLGSLASGVLGVLILRLSAPEGRKPEGKASAAQA
jgi:Na+:H+ antiporter, NhaA family